MKIFFTLAALLLAGYGAMAQTVSGVVVDEKTGEPIMGSTVIEAGTTNGTATDLDGQFNLSVTNRQGQLEITFLGYEVEKTTYSVVGKSVNVGTVLLAEESKTLSDVTIRSAIAVARKTPVAMSSLDPVIIEEKLGSQEFPEVLKSTPGVYATKQGGGFGDSRINMRGFSSANIAVLVNGVPVNDMEWGGVYWSNWSGLSDVTRSMQTQRGIGASKVSSPSVGGSINIVTKTIDAKRGGSLYYSMGNDGYNKVLFTVATGMNERGWALSVLGAKTWGDGYVQGTEFEAYSYFANLSKRINDDHQLSFTVIGGPQQHNQRSNYDGLTIEGWQQVADFMKGDSPYKYNPTYGFGKNGERKTSAKNVYHKPQLSLNHQWQINERKSLSTSLYVSIGRGNGTSGQGHTSSLANQWYGASNGSLNYTFRNADGTFAYDKIQELNEQSAVGSQMVMSINKNYHNWYGLLSTYENNVTDFLELSGGVDFRYYKGVHTNEISDLYNGQYYNDLRYRANVKAENNAAAADPGFRYEKLHVGDVVYRDYDSYTMQWGGFLQAELSLDKITAFVAGSLSNTTYWRYDRFYYDKEHAESDHLDFMGFTAKGGVNYNLTENHNLFANVGYISRAPFFSGGAFLQTTTSNATNPDAVNEKIFSVEAGYGFHSNFLTANVNAYLTKWLDKTMARSDLQKDICINMEGVNAKHMGVEVDFKAQPTTWLGITGMLSLGDWIWDCETEGYFYDLAGQPLKSEQVDASGNRYASGIKSDDHAKSQLILDKVKVGGSAQTTAAIGLKFKPMKGMKVGVDYNLYARNYAEWSLNTSDMAFNKSKTYESPWRIPSSYTFDLNASYYFSLAKDLRVTVSGNVNNLLDNTYIVDAIDDGKNHDWQSAYRIFYGFGRTYSLKLKLAF